MSRQNLCPNPAAKNNATGYSGTGTPVRATDFPTPACPRSTGVRTSTAGFLQTPTAACAPGDVFTLSFYGHNGSASDFDFGHTVYIAYTRSSGGDAFPQTQGFTTGAVGTTARFSITANAAPALATGVYLLWDSLAVGYGLTGVLLEKVGALDTYGDGDTSGWVWDGTNGNSTSTFTSTTPVSNTLDTPWTVRNAVAGTLDTPYTVREVVSRSLDTPWVGRAQVAQTLDTPWATRGLVSATLDTPWTLRNQINALLDTPWTVRARVTATLQTLWVVEGVNTSLPANVTANLTDRVTAYLDVWP